MVHGLLSRSTEADPAGLQAPVAQGIELSPSKREAAGSNPAGGALEEEWRDVVGFEGWYEVSDLGRVRRSRPGTATRPGRILKPTKDSGGYQHLELCREGIRTTRLVHVLVSGAFLGPCPAGFEIDHVNGDKADNRPSKLEYVPHRLNVARAIRRHLSRGRKWGRPVNPLALATAIVNAASEAS